MPWIRNVAGQVRVGVDVDLGELDLAAARGDGLLEHRPELAARAAPLGPEVDDDRHRVRALDYGGLEGALGDVHIALMVAVSASGVIAAPIG